jgi:hypothetical protein
VRLNNVASGATSADWFMLVPVSFGGYAYFHDSTAAEAISQFDVLPGGVVLVDSAVDMTDCGAPGRGLLASSDDRLIVCSEEVASDETTHVVSLLPFAVPRYSLWR